MTRDRRRVGAKHTYQRGPSVNHTAATTPVIQIEPYQVLNLGLSLTG